MGLDQYLSAVVHAPEGSALFKVVDSGLTDKHREDMVAFEPDYPDYEPSAYLSGWTFGDRVPEPLFVAISEELGYSPTSESPSIEVYKTPAGYRVEPTIYYWRKANAIHRWFVDNVQDGMDECKPHEVHPEMLMDLLDRIERVHVDHDQAHELLPTQGGFFFGPTEYGEWYFENIDHDAANLKKAVAAAMPTASAFSYRSSW